MQLSKSTLSAVSDIELPDASYFRLPEKVLQFGTGVLLRGLPDFFIDKANKRGHFNGRVVVVKSTGGDVSDFEKQDCLYTHRICGIENGKVVSRDIVNASISRVLSASSQWETVLACAADPEMRIVISNTTEVGIAYLEEKIDSGVPASFPGKLLAFLQRRYKSFDGDAGKGFVIIPTELIPQNGVLLREIVLRLAAFNNFDEHIIHWISEHNVFCDSLVDRIVPGKLPANDKRELDAKLGCTDDLTIVSEPYGLWAIEAKSPAVARELTFAATDNGVVIANDITKFRELKLRLLNGTHTLSSGLAVLEGYETVGAAMKGAIFEEFIRPLLFDEIIPAVIGSDITQTEAVNFGNMVLDRFRNPFIEHKWINITLQYSSKMAMRNLPLLIVSIARVQKVPILIARGFAAHILFMKCELAADGKYFGKVGMSAYPVTDDNASRYAKAWASGDAALAVRSVLSDTALWKQDLNEIPGFETEVTAQLNQLMQKNEGFS